jgi:serine/threonine protein kinase
LNYYSNKDLIQLYGFTQNPDNLDYMIVMNYAENGNLRKNLQNIVKDKWIVKLKKLHHTILGLNNIHQQKLVHCDFHHGNILLNQGSLSISDLGLCKPVESFQSFKQNEIYGVLPFVAPEILRGKPYTLASDIYSFSMIMWEFTSGVPPFDDREHGLQLALNICRGERPKIIENTPQCYIELMEKCWETDPLKRPNASEIKEIIETWYKTVIDYRELKNKEITMEFWQAEERQNNNIFKSINEKSDIKPHQQAYHTSRLLDFTTKLNEILIQEDIEIYDQTNKLFETEITQSIGKYLMF